MLIVKLAILERVFCPQKMVASTAFATRSGGSVCPEIPWSVCPETVGQLAPKWCGLIHHNLQTRQILKYEPLVKAIIHMGTLQDPFTFFLYILIDDKRYFLNYEVNELIELTVSPLVPLFVIIESADIVQATSGQDRQFLDYALARGFTAYQANGFSLEKSVSDKRISAESDLDQIWAWWQGQSRLYFKGIHYYVKRQEYEMALYNLHQSMEMSLLGLLQVKTGFHTTIPNFRRLLKMTLLFTDQVNLFFEKLETSDPDLHHLLWNVYPEELRQNLVINESQIERLVLHANNLFAMIAQLVKSDF